MTDVWVMNVRIQYRLPGTYWFPGSIYVDRWRMPHDNNYYCRGLIIKRVSY